MMTQDWLLKPQQPESGLTLAEVNEAIRRAGRARGYEVIAEYPLMVNEKRRKIDWVWRDHQGNVIRAFEVEGRNVPTISLDNDQQKFAALRKAQSLAKMRCAVVTYNVRFIDDEGWGTLPNSPAAIARLLALPREIEWIEDTHLLDCLAD